MAKVTHTDIGSELRAISLSGYLDVKGTEEVQEPFSSLFSGTMKRVVVDLTDLTFLSSMGIRLLVINGKSLHAAGGRMALVVGVNAAVIKVLKTTCVDAIIPMFESFEQAEAALTG